MKKVITLLFALCLSVTLCACSGDEPSDHTADGQEQTTTTTQSDVSVQTTTTATPTTTTGDPCLNGHTEVIDPATAATCSSVGKTEGAHCSVCGTVTKAQSELPMLDHVYIGTVTTEATCAEEGVKTFDCENCDAVYTEAIPKSEEHDIDWDNCTVVREGSCTVGAIERYTCTVCGATETLNYEVMGHMPDDDWKCEECGEYCSPEQYMKDYLSHVEPNANDVYYISQRKVWHQDEEGRYVFVFSFLDEEEVEIEAPTLVDVRIVNDDGVVVYSATRGVFYDDFVEWTYNGSITRNQATVYIDDSLITPGTALSGTLYYKIYNPDIFEFDEYSLTIDDSLPLTDFEPITFTGTGDRVITGIDLPDGTFRAWVSYSGSDYFNVKLYYDDSDYDLIGNDVGSFVSSTALTGLEGKGVTDGYLEIEGNGAWTVTIERITDTCTTNIAGYGDTATGIITATQARNTITVTFEGDGNFIVRLYELNGTSYDLVANEIDYCNKQKVVTLEVGKQYYFAIQGDGRWTIDFGLGDALTEYNNQTAPSTPGSGSDDDTKWSFSEASTLNQYASGATEAMTDSLEYINEAFSASSSSMKAYYYSAAISSAKSAQKYLGLMKTLCESNASLELNGEYATLLEYIESTYDKCAEIASIEVSSSNLPDYSTVSRQVVEAGNDCLSIQGITVELLGLF